MLDRALPGFPMPFHVRFSLAMAEDSTWELTVWAGDRPGFATRADSDVYEGLTWQEAGDVIGAVMDGFQALA